MSLTNIKMCGKVTIPHSVTGAGENEQINGTKKGQETTKICIDGNLVYNKGASIKS